jgi:hypothetical protein
VELGFLIMTKGGVIIDIIYILIYFEVSRSSTLPWSCLYVLIIYCKTKIRYKIKEEEDDEELQRKNSSASSSPFPPQFFPAVLDFTVPHHPHNPFCPLAFIELLFQRQ